MRIQGYSLDSNQRYDGRSSIAAPIFDNNYQCIAALALVCTTDTFEEKKDLFLQKVLQTASVISQEMGCPSPQANEFR